MLNVVSSLNHSYFNYNFCRLIFFPDYSFLAIELSLQVKERGKTRERWKRKRKGKGKGKGKGKEKGKGKREKQNRKANNPWQTNFTFQSDVINIETLI